MYSSDVHIVCNMYVSHITCRRPNNRRAKVATATIEFSISNCLKFFSAYAVQSVNMMDNSEHNKLLYQYCKTIHRLLQYLRYNYISERFREDIQSLSHACLQNTTIVLQIILYIVKYIWDLTNVKIACNAKRNTVINMYCNKIKLIERILDLKLFLKAVVVCSCEARCAL